jgi:ribonucleoside-diphosphate reductase alpha chain
MPQSPDATKPPKRKLAKATKSQSATFRSLPQAEKAQTDQGPELELRTGQIIRLPARKTGTENKGLSFNRHFSQEAVHPYQAVNWTRALYKKEGFQREIEAPSFWAYNDVLITAEKYLYGSRTGEPEFEDSLRHAIDRITNTYTIWGWEEGYFKTLEDAQIFNEELKAMQLNQIWAPNSPVWFNIGHFEQWRWGRPDLRERLGKRGARAYSTTAALHGQLEHSIQVKETSTLESPQTAACQPGWALINTPDGLIPIKEIVEQVEQGQQVTVLAGLRKTRVLAVKRNGIKTVYQVKLRDGNSIVATADHLICSHAHRRTLKPQWNHLDQLKVGEYLRLYTKTHLLENQNNHPTETELAEAFLAGWNQADGLCVQYPKALNHSIIMEWIALDDIEEQALRSAAAKALPNGPIHNTKHKTLSGGASLRRIRMSGEHLRNFADKYDLWKRRENIRAPQLMFKAHPRTVAAYLRGAFQADGSINVRHDAAHICIDTISHNWITDIQTLLNRIGIYNAITHKNGARHNQQGTSCLSISYLTERIAFQEKIGFLPNHRKDQLTLGSLAHRGKCSQTIKYTPIESITKLGEEEVFDIQTEAESYLTNNILVHNCFLTEVDDSMESILEHFIVEGRIFSSGSGVGINLSSLRSSYEPITGKGKSSGPISFDKGFDRSAGSIKSGGKTRRAARMVALFSDHPDIFKFIRTKNDQEEIGKIVLKEHNTIVRLKLLAEEKLKTGTTAEQTVARMVLALPEVNRIDYSAGMDDLLYGETVSHQNANHSVSLKGDFWRSYYAGSTYSTRWVTNPDKIQDTFPASKLLDAMCESAWANAEPGNHNNDWINLWNPVKSQGDIVTSNPCSEYVFLNNTSCNLSSFNAARFLRADRTFDAEALRDACKIAMTCADLNIQRSGFPTPEIALRTRKYRTTGIGYTNIGGTLMKLGIPYDSDEGRYIAAQLVAALHSSCWLTSAELGSQLAAFSSYEDCKNDLREVLNLHAACFEQLEDLSADPAQICRGRHLPHAQGLTGIDALRALQKSFVNKTISATVRSICAELSKVSHNNFEGIAQAHRFRNSFCSLIAPTGTISFPLGAYTSGTSSIEPDYSLVKWKNLSGGGMIQMFNEASLTALRNLGYPEELVREAALEVAGINGLFTACGEDQAATINHLIHGHHEAGPVHQALKRILHPDVALNGTASQEKAETLFKQRSSFEHQDADHALVVTGKNHLEQVPWLNPAHLAVFDCSATHGDGQRSIHILGHLRMLGAIQPFLSGASSKTCNLPYSATVDDFRDAYVASHQLGVKCIALYRADSKGISVFSTDTPEGKKYNADLIWPKLVAMQETALAQNCQPTIAAHPTRRKLRGRRQAQTVKFQIQELKGYLTVGTYPDSTCGEIFCRVGQSGTFASGILETWCKSISVMLQYGVPLDEIIEDFRSIAFEPSGFGIMGLDGETEGDSKTISVSSIVDMIIKILDHLFPIKTGRKLEPIEMGHPIFAFVRTLDTKETRHSLVQSALNPPDLFAEPIHASANHTLNNPTLTRLDRGGTLCPKCFQMSYTQDGRCKHCTNPSCGYKDGGCGE